MIKQTLLLACAALLMLAGSAQAQTLQCRQPAPQAAKPGTPVKLDPDARIVWKTPKPAPQRVADQADETSALALVNCDGTIVSSGFYFCPGEPYTVTATFSNSGTAFEGDLYMLLMVQDASDGTLYIYHQSQPAAASIAQGGEQQVTLQGQIEAAMPYYDSYIVGFSSDLQNLIMTDGGTYGYVAIVGAPVIIEETPSTLLIQGQGFGRGACTVRLRNITGTDWSDDLSLTLMDQQGVEYWITDPIPASVLQGQAIDWELYYDMRGVPLGSYEMSLRFNADGETVASSYRLFMLDGGDTWPVEVEEAVPVSVYIDGLEYTADPAMQTASVTGYEGEPVDVVIPATVNIDGADYPVTAIGDQAFYDCASLQSIILPEGLQSIGNRAFTLCTSLGTIELPSSLSSIGYRAFSSCESLKSMVVPEGITTLGIYTFSQCRSLESVTLPSTLQNMDDGVFSGCPALADITCNAMTPPVINGTLFGDDEVYKQVTLHVPAEAEDAYRTAEGWKNFFDNAAQYELTYATDPATQTATVTGYTGEPVDLVIPATVNIDGTDYPVTSVGEMAFMYCQSLESATIPEGVTYIGQSAFDSCHSLTSVSLPEGLQTLDIRAFALCPALTSIDIPSTVTSMRSAFYGCSSLADVYLAEGLKTVSGSAFVGCALKSIVLPSTLQSIGDRAFADCPLEEITSLAAVPPLMQERGGTFDDETYATATLYVPEGARPLYQGATGWMDFFDKATVDGLAYTFDEEGMTAAVVGYEGEPVDLAIPASVNIDGTDYAVTAIGDNAFYRCESLQSVTLPEGVASIGIYAFYACPALQSVTLPSTLASIGNWAFSGCAALANITCQALVPPAIGEHTFLAVTFEAAAFTVPQEAEEAYRSDRLWALFCTSIQMDGVFYGVYGGDEGATVIGFAGIITIADIPAAVNINGTDYAVTGIAGQAFYYCDSLESLTLPSTLQTIGDDAFSDCSVLTGVDIPEGVTNIGERAFAWCGLQSVTLPSTLQSIGGEAFWDCPLTDVHCHALVPPVMLAGEASEMMSEAGAFDEDTYATATLYVPSEAVGNYQAAQYWEKFLNIVGDLPSVSISSMATDESFVTYANGTIAVSAPADIRVYAQDGAKVRHAADATSLSLEGLPRGIYIICIEQGGERQVMKVVR